MAAKAEQERLAKEKAAKEAADKAKKEKERAAKAEAERKAQEAALNDIFGSLSEESQQNNAARQQFVTSEVGAMEHLHPAHPAESVSGRQFSREAV